MSAKMPLNNNFWSQPFFPLDWSCNMEPQENQRTSTHGAELPITSCSHWSPRSPPRCHWPLLPPPHRPDTLLICAEKLDLNLSLIPRKAGAALRYNLSAALPSSSQLSPRHCREAQAGLGSPRHAPALSLN
ncbi:hypothetical protein E2C01_027890 [Portunus trituberculatus]|uniref:Uncharacterized protein n=1 Tax=Portunus trituberculatus TaxID=210409 RepID=A0A5B7EME3_PORTR|nr:hypothetical protein [Portunus trituberculatus]